MEGRQFNRRTSPSWWCLRHCCCCFGVLYNLQVLHSGRLPGPERGQDCQPEDGGGRPWGAAGPLRPEHGDQPCHLPAHAEYRCDGGGGGAQRQPAGAAQHLPGQRPDLDRHPGRLNGSPFTYTSDTPGLREGRGRRLLTRLGRLLNALPMKRRLKSSLNLPTTEQVEAAKTLDDIPAGPTAEELIAALRTYFEIDPSWSDADAAPDRCALRDQSAHLQHQPAGVHLCPGM